MTDPLAVVLFKWHTPGYRGQFEAVHVNVMRNMIERHYHSPHRVVCITDDPAGIDPRIETLPLWDDLAEVPNPTGGGRPSCYRRLKLWHESMRDILGPRFVTIDLDAVILSDITPLWSRQEPIVCWHNSDSQWPISGGMLMADTGTRPDIWHDFDPATSPAMTHALGYHGSDQGWLSYKLGGQVATWSAPDGVYYHQSARHQPPSNARIVLFVAQRAPWLQLRKPWIREAWR